MRTFIPDLGVLICERAEPQFPFPDRRFSRALCRVGQRLGMRVIVFAAGWVDWSTQQVSAYVWDEAAAMWRQRTCSLPRLIFDRAFVKHKQHYRDKIHFMRQLKQHPRIRLLGRGVRDKWEVYHALNHHTAIQSYLPKTRVLQPGTLRNWLTQTQASSAFLKPLSGSHGKGIFRIQQQEQDRFIVQGRDRHNTRFDTQFHSLSDCLQWAHRFIGTRRYLIQPDLQLEDSDGRPFDVRALLQRDGFGQWKQTGMCVRQGSAKSLTSNLHGGGNAQPILPFLNERFGESRSLSIISELERLCRLLPDPLEQAFGPQVELGIDFGIDPNGRIWLIEVNSRPGRDAFRLEQDTRRQSIESPVRYAKYLLERQLGG